MEEELPTLVRRLHTHAGKAVAVAMAVERGILFDVDFLDKYPANGLNGQQNGHNYGLSLATAEYHENLGLHERLIRNK
ncbi:hypothetical protein HYX08_00390 [Candidatus Woesearchaeota archaeon]|nr:hypothetical protein [Candidatus Woesearchaeota archaeon]